MIDPENRHGRDLIAAEKFFALAKSAPSPFMRKYYQRVAERYLSSQGELKSEVAFSAWTPDFGARGQLQKEKGPKV